MWSVWQTCRTGRRAAGFLGGLLVALLLAAAPAAGQEVVFTVLPEPLSNGGLLPDTPAVAVTSSGQVYVAWVEGGEILFKRSQETPGSCGSAGGLRFEPNPPLKLSNAGSAVASADSPSIATNDGSGIFVVWREVPKGFTSPAKQSIRFARLVDGGVSGVSFETLPADYLCLESKCTDRNAPISPAVAADKNGGVFVAWQDTLAFKNSVLMAQSLNGGPPNPVNVTSTLGRPASRQPSVASDGSTVHVIWREGTAVLYKGFTPGISGLTPVGDPKVVESLTASGSQPFPKIAVHASGVTAAWVQGITTGTSITARTMPSGGTSFGPPEAPYSSPLSLSNLSISFSFGSAGRFFAWQEGSSIRYLRGTATGPLPSGPSAGAPFVGQGGAARLVASWREDGTPTEVRLAYTGGSDGESEMSADVRVMPPKVNRRTINVPGEPSLTVFVRLPVGREIDGGSVRMNGRYPLSGPTAAGNYSGGGAGEVMLKFSRSVLNYSEVDGKLLNGPPTGRYKVKGNITGGGCFSGPVDGKVDIVP